MDFTLRVFTVVFCCTSLVALTGCGGSESSEGTRSVYEIRSGSLAIQENSAKSSSTAEKVLVLESVESEVSYRLNTDEGSASGVVQIADFFGWWEHPKDPLSVADRRYEAQITTLTPDGTRSVYTALIHSPQYDPDNPSRLVFSYEDTDIPSATFSDLEKSYSSHGKSGSINHSLQVQCNDCALPSPIDHKPLPVEAPLDYIYTSEFTEIWSDSGSGAGDSTSIWLPVPPSDEYKEYIPIGAYAKSHFSSPDSGTRAILINKNSKGVKLATSFTVKWNSSGSGAHHVNVGRLSAETGYVCLGDFAYKGELEEIGKQYDMPQNPGQFFEYACISEDLAAPAEIHVTDVFTPHRNDSYIWDDHGSGGHHDGSFWRNTRTADGAYFNTFLSFNSHHATSSSDYFTLTSFDLKSKETE